MLRIVQMKYAVLLKRLLCIVLMISTISNCFAVMPYAANRNCAVINFKSSESGPVVFTRVVNKDEVIISPTANELKAFDAPADKVISGWYLEGETGQNPVDFDNLICNGTDLTFIPLFNDAAMYYVFFEAAGSETDIVTVPRNDTVSSQTPVRDGYMFKFWSEDGTNAFDFSTPITKHTFLQAIWEPCEVSYTIKFYLENSNMSSDAVPGNMDQYTFLEYVRLTGSAGSTPVITQDMDGLRDYFEGQVAGSILGYTELQSVQTAEISGDGTTIINAFLTRKAYTITYNLGDQDGREMLLDGVTYRAGVNEPQYSKQVKFGNNIGGPNVDTEYTSPDAYSVLAWITAENQSNHPVIYPKSVLNENLLCYDSQTLERTWEAFWGRIDTKNEFRFFVEPLPDELADNANYILTVPSDATAVSADVRGKTFIYYPQNDMVAYAPYIYPARSVGGYLNGFAPLCPDRSVPPKAYNQHIYQNDEGFHPVSVSDKPTDARRVHAFFFSRNSHSLEFDLQASGSSVSHDFALTQTVPYDKPLAGYEPLQPPTRTGYKFLGWYADLNGVEPFDFTAEFMPDTDLILHAKWQEEKNEYTVNFYEYYGGPLVDSQVVYEGESAVDKAEYIIGSQYALGEFSGWRYHIVDGISSAFDFQLPILKNMDIFASWNPATVEIVYQTGDGTGAVPVNQNCYLPGNTVRIQDGKGLIGNNSGSFLHWVDVDGNVYTVNDLLKIERDTTLTAKYTSSSVNPGGPGPSNPGTVDPGTLEPSAPENNTEIPEIVEPTDPSWPETVDPGVIEPSGTEERPGSPNHKTPRKPLKSGNSKDKVNGPNTGDDTKVWISWLLAITAFLGLVATIAIKKRSEKSEEDDDNC